MMKRWLNSPWVVTVLCAAAAYFVAQSLFDWGGRPRPAVTPATAAEIDEADEEDEYGYEIENPVSVDEALAQLDIPENPPDPFGSMTRAPVVSVQSAAPEKVETVHLTGIWQQGAAWLLLINGRVCEIGDQIGRITIESANLDGVWLSHRAGRDFLPFGEVFSLTTSANDNGAINSNDDEL